MTPRDVVLAVMVVLLWGLNFAVTKSALDEVPPLVLVALRFALVAVLLVPVVKVPRAHLGRIGLLSVSLGLVHFSMMFTALQYVDAAVASITVQIQVPFAALLAAVLYGDKLGWRRASGMVVAIAGVAIIAGEPRTGSALWAVGMVVAAALVWAVANIQMKGLDQANVHAINAYLGLFAAPQLALASLLLEDGQWQAIASASWVVWGALAYQSVVVVILCYGLWYGLLRRYPVNNVMPFTLLVPVFGVLGGVTIRDEPVTWHLMVGGLLTVAGVGIIVLRRPKLTARMFKDT